MDSHQFRKLGCQDSSARWSRRSSRRSTLLGIFSVESAGVVTESDSLSVEVGALPGAVLAQRTVGARGVRAVEDPVLPGGQPAEDLGFQRLGAGEAVVRL